MDEVIDRTRIRGKWIKLGDPLHHFPSGEYLGVVTAISESAVVLDYDHGPRGRGIATRYEVSAAPYRRGVR